MKKLLCLCITFSLIFSLNCIIVSAEESRLPKNLEYTQYSGKIIEAEYVYGTMMARGVLDFYSIKGSDPEYPEYNAGAHYYAYSAVTSDYSEAYTRVVLPTELQRNNNYSGRNAYISLGLIGTAGWLGIDIGIRNDGNGWHPYYYESYNDKKFVVFDECTVDERAKTAVIIATPTTTTTIQMYIQFLDESGYEITHFWQVIDMKSGNFQLGYNGEVACCYYRFASLVNYLNEPDNQEDGTYMLGGNFNGLALYNRDTHTYENWGMTSTLVNQAWEISPENIYVRFATGSDTEWFDIDHRP